MSQKDVAKLGHNVRISPRAWELLRWAKLEKESKSYSELLKDLNSKIAKNRLKELEAELEHFDKRLHQVSSKDAKNSKTVLLDDEARKILETIKVESNDPAFTFSDAIEFLIKTNKIKIPDHLVRQDI